MRKIFKSAFLTLGLIGFGLVQGNAQNENNGWTLGLGGGFMSYYGDLSPNHVNDAGHWYRFFKSFQYYRYYTDQPAFGITLEKRFTPGLGIMLSANEGSFGMSDRYRKNNGAYDLTNPNWDRALNFRTHVLDFGAALTFRSDNGKMLKKNATVAPYFYIGGGLTYFQVKGDLFDQQGNPYNYSDPNVQPDGVYETNLRDALNETDSKYANWVPYVNLGLGVKFRISRVLSIALQTDLKYAGSDYLDDVSGKYKVAYPSPRALYIAHPGTNPIPEDFKRGYDNGANDFYIFNKAVIQITFGNRRKHFKTPVIYAPSSAYFQGNNEEHSSGFKTNMGEEHPQYRRQGSENGGRNNSRFEGRRNPRSHVMIPIDSIGVYSDPSVVLVRKDTVSPMSANQPTVDSVALLSQYRLFLVDSIKNIHDSLERSYAKNLKTDADQSSRILALNKTLDSVREMNDSLLAKHRQGAVLRQKALDHQADSLLSLRDKLQKQFNNEIAQRAMDSAADAHTIEVLTQKLETDSLLSIQVQKAHDSLLTLRDSLNGVDSALALRKQTFFQKAFGVRQNRERENNQKAVADLNQQIRDNQQEIARLSSELDQTRKLKTASTTKTIVPNNADPQVMAQLSQIQSRLDELNLQRANSGVNLNPTLAPIVGIGRSNKANNEDVRTLNQRMDSLEEAYNREEQDSLRNVVKRGSWQLAGQVDSQSLARQDSLKVELVNKISGNQEAVNNQTMLIQALSAKVDSLTQRVGYLQRKDTVSTKPTKMQFPVISTYFKTGAATLSITESDKLRAVAVIKSRMKKIVLKGFTDGTGNATVNQRIAQQRCNYVRNLLIKKYGISSSKIEVGAIELSDTKGSDPMSRRVDLIVED